MTDVSVILCTRNRCDQVQPAIGSIQAAAAAVPDLKIQLIVVDNGSTDGTFNIANKIAEASALPIIVLEEPRPGVCCAKNAGIARAAGRILVFTDDDCRLTLTYFADLRRHYAGETGPIVRGGRVDLGDPTDLPFTIKTEDEASYLGGITHPGGFLHGCNMTLTREVIDRIGVFDERFGPGGSFKAAEETDLYYRAAKAGIKVQYVPDMAIMHFHGRKTLEGIRRLNHGYHVGNGALYAKHGFFDPLLRRHMWWVARNTVREWFGGPLFNEELALSHRHLLIAQVKGAAMYVLGMGKVP